MATGAADPEGSQASPLGPAEGTRVGPRTAAEFAGHGTESADGHRSGGPAGLPLDYSLRPDQVVEGLAAADEADAAVLDEDLGRARAHVVVRGHGEAVGPGVAHGEQVARLRPLELAAAGQEVARLAHRPHHVHELRRPPARDAPAPPGGRRRRAPAAAGRSCPRRPPRTSSRGRPSRRGRGSAARRSRATSDRPGSRTSVERQRSPPRAGRPTRARTRPARRGRRSSRPGRRRGRSCAAGSPRRGAAGSGRRGRARPRPAARGR